MKQVFLKALTNAQKLHWRTTIFAEHLPMAASALKHGNDIIIKNAESLKLFWYEEVAGRWVDINGKPFQQVFNAQKNVFHAFSFQLCFSANSKFSFYVSLRGLNLLNLFKL